MGEKANLDPAVVAESRGLAGQALDAGKGGAARIAGTAADTAVGAAVTAAGTAAQGRGRQPKSTEGDEADGDSDGDGAAGAR